MPISVNYGIMFGLTLLAKIVVRIITGSKNNDSHHDLFRKLNIQNLQSRYIFSLFCFTIMKTDQYIQTLMSMAQIKKNLLFIMQYRILYFIEGVLIIWASRFKTAYRPI
jgi:hypothetical protein